MTTFRPTNKHFILLPHWMKNPWSLKIKGIETPRLIFHKFSWLQKWKLIKVVFTKPTILRRYGRCGNGRRSSSFSGSSYAQYSTFNFFQCWGVYQQWANLQAKRIVRFPRTSSLPFLSTREFWTAKGKDLEEIPDEIKDAPLSELFFTTKMKLLRVPDGFMLYGNLEVVFFSTSQLLYPNMKSRLRLIRATPNFYRNIQNPYVRHGIIHCSLYTHRIALKDEYHKKRIDMLCLYSRGVQLLGNYSEDFHHSCRTKPVHLRKHFEQCSSSPDGYCKENELCCQWIVHWEPILVSTVGF